MRQAFERFGIALDPDVLVGRLGTADRALVAMAIALDPSETESGLLVLDEATASMPERQAHRLLDVVSGLASDGLSVLMVTHRVPEVVEYADQVTVLDSGQVAYTSRPGREAKRPDADMLFSLLGAQPTAMQSSASAVSETSATTGSPVVLHACGLGSSEAGGMDLEVHAGEIVGLAGLADSGLHAFTRGLVGAPRAGRGTVRVGDRVIRNVNPLRAKEQGVVLIPSDRRREGGAMSLDLIENVLMPQLKPIWRRGSRADRDTVAEALTAFDVRPPNPRALLGTLSGGNQQKAIIAKWMLIEPLVMIFDDPTVGVDPASRQRIFSLMRAAAQRGAGVIFTTSEPAQFATVCDRVMLMRSGRLVDEAIGAEVTQERITRWLAE